MERIEYDAADGEVTDHYVMQLHLQAYTFAHQFVYGQRVLDAACGAGFGTMIYSVGARSIVGVDRDRKALAKAKALPHWCPVTFLRKDLNRDALPEADICVSVETIEHLEPGGFFLRNLKVKQLVFTVPVNMPGGHHTIHFPTPFAVQDHLRECGWNPQMCVLQDRVIAVNVPAGILHLRSQALVGIAQR